MRFKNQVALVTGASRGIGRDIALALAREGADVAVLATTLEGAAATAAEIRALGQRALALACRVQIAAEVSAAFARTAEELGPVQLLVNNAGFGMVSAVEETDVGQALELIQVNVTCLTALTLSAAKEMVRRGHGGIINIGSIASFQPVAYMGVYAASKAYVLHFSEALWAELRPRGVTVTTLCPGTTRTEFFDRSGVPGWAERNRGQDVQTVVRTGLAAFDAGRQYVISGWMNYLVSLAVRLATRASVVEWSLSIFRPRYSREGH